ncbi:potassium-transporting ATPase subunit KdpC [Clostridium sp. FP2]|uniref:potassium-transporting ATPase subunit KdpC n=1 Tax=Clostridium sp. FP2 TaxID=2724481 RepID=UPI0013E8FF22|nr:potassium-transporting ATPase subunit KdpC [Clostridium sp. FP2]MBZ9621372.1 potassium-transporting ATPase subunit KdpC [Clostridium sp. FP2]
MKVLKKSILVSVTLMFICGFVFPTVMTGVGKLFFNNKANGSMITVNGREVGSELIGQNFTDARYFHGRISAVNYNTYKEGDKISLSSGSANLAPSNKALTERIQKDMNEFLKANPEVKKEAIPADFLTSSGSGLDPHISPEAAKIQIPAISKATGIAKSDLEQMVKNNTEERQLGVFGNKRVNVLKLNIEVGSKLH